MATLFDKIKKALGFYPKVSYYKMDQNTGEPVKVTFTPAPEPIPEPIPEPVIEEPISSQEAAVDTKDDGFDLSAMTKAELLAFAKERGIAATAKMKKQEIVDAINAQV